MVPAAHFMVGLSLNNTVEGITGQLWMLGRTRQYIQKRFYKVVNERTLSDYMRRWGMSCQRPVKRARKQNPTGI